MVTRSDLVSLPCWLQLLVNLSCFGYNMFKRVCFVSLTERTPSSFCFVVSFVCLNNDTHFTAAVDIGNYVH